jgi:hypothetical protein
VRPLPQFQVLRPVIGAHPVPMMNSFVSRKMSPKDSLHHKSMLKYVAC